MESGTSPAKTMNIGQVPAAAPRRKVMAKRRKASSPDPARPETASEVAHLKAAVASMGLKLSDYSHRIGTLKAALHESRRSPTASAGFGAPAALEKRLQSAEEKFDSQLARQNCSCSRPFQANSRRLQGRPLTDCLPFSSNWTSSRRTPKGTF